MIQRLNSPRDGMERRARARSVARWMVAVALLGCAAPAAPPVTPYLGQKPPGSQPEVFAPEKVSRKDAYEYGSVWSADGLELYFGVNVGGRAEIRGIRWTDGAWGEEMVVVADEVHTFGDPFLSPDGQRLYFISNRPLEDLEGESKDFDIWFVPREPAGWGSAINVGSPVNTPGDEYYISFSEQGRIYYSSNTAAGEGSDNFDMYSAQPSGAGFEAAEMLPGYANTEDYEADAFVAPDESYLIYGSTRRDGLGRGDLYISFREDDETWSEGVNLGAPINTSGHELCPFVTADGRYFFYTSAEDIYWVDAAVLEKFRPSKTKK